MFNTHKYSGTPDKADTWLIQTLATTDSGLKLGPTPYISLKLTRLIRTFRNKDNFSWFQLRCAYTNRVWLYRTFHGQDENNFQ